MNEGTAWRAIVTVKTYFRCWQPLKDGNTAVKKRQIYLGVAVAAFILFTVAYSFKSTQYVSACGCDTKPIQKGCRPFCRRSSKLGSKQKTYRLLPVNSSDTFKISHVLQLEEVLSGAFERTDKQKHSSATTVSRGTVAEVTDTDRIVPRVTSTDRVVPRVTNTDRKNENLSIEQDNHLNKSDLAKATWMPAATLRTTTTGPEIVRNVENCHGCLAGKVLISVQKGWLCGGTRLGNKLSMMAAAIGAAANSNMTFVIVKASEDCGWVDELQSLFVSLNSTVPVLPYSMMSNWQVEGEPGFTAFKNIQQRNQNFTIAGYRQTWKYFSSDAQKEAVRSMYQFTSTYKQHAYNTLLNIRDVFKSVISSPVFIALHMRIGDIVGSTYGYQMANKTFYDHVLSVVSQRFPKENIIFVAASDSPAYGRRMLKDAQKIYYIVWLSGSAFEDFAVLSSCNHSVISGGTYGFWAGWLAGGEVYYFVNFSKVGTAFHRGFNSDNFYERSWVPVSWS